MCLELKFWNYFPGSYDVGRFQDENLREKGKEKIGKRRKEEEEKFLHKENYLYRIF